MKYIFLVLIGAFCSHGYAQDYSVIRHIGGGVIVPQEKYPAVVQIHIKKKDGSNSYCTATVVGPRAILTNAHCGWERDAQNEDFVPADSTGTFSIGSKRYTFKLIPHGVTGTEVIMRRKLDVALGITTEVIKNVKPIAINFTADHGNKMIALGYGCTGHLSETYVKNREPNLAKEDHIERFLISSDDKEVVFICGGDSGGPTLSYTTDMKLQISSIHMRRMATNDGFWEVRADHTWLVGFIQDIATQNNLRICGYNLECD